MRGGSRALGVSLLCALAVVEPAAGALQTRRPQRATAPPPPFQGTLAEARALAADRHVPLLFAAIFEDEGWDPKDHHDQVGLRRDVLAGSELAEVLQRSVVALGCNRPHQLEEVEVASGETKITVRRCPSYYTDSCTVHQRLFEDSYGAWNKDGELVSPYVVLIAPSGEVSVLRDNGSTPTAAELRESLEKAQKAAGQGLTAEEYTKVLQHQTAARAAVQEGKDGKAWSAWNEMLSIAHASRYAEMARQGSAAALTALEAARGLAQKELEAGKGVDAYRILADLAAEWAGTPHERELGLKLRELEQDKQHRT